MPLLSKIYVEKQLLIHDFDPSLSWIWFSFGDNQEEQGYTQGTSAIFYNLFQCFLRKNAWQKSIFTNGRSKICERTWEKYNCAQLQYNLADISEAWMCDSDRRSLMLKKFRNQTKFCLKLILRQHYNSIYPFMFKFDLILWTASIHLLFASVNAIEVQQGNVSRWSCNPCF
jgi:hypothetical protein